MKPVSLFLLMVIILSCGHQKQEATKTSPQLAHLRHIINTTKCLELPYYFDASNWSFTNPYVLDPKGIDSLFFYIIGQQAIYHFPDTSSYFAILSGIAGDMLYPCITTFDKNGNLIAKETIGTGNCVASPIVEVTSCFDSVFIRSDLSFYSFSELKGIGEPIDSLQKMNDVSSSSKLNGKILLDGRLIIDKE